MNYIEEIKQDMYTAMKSKDKVKATILRSFLSNLKKIEIEKKEPIAEHEYLSIVKKMVKQLKESIDVYSQAGRIELAEKEKSELEIIQVYLPEQLSEEKTIELVEEVISEIPEEEFIINEVKSDPIKEETLEVEEQTMLSFDLPLQQTNSTVEENNNIERNKNNIIKNIITVFFDFGTVFCLKYFFLDSFSLMYLGL